MKSPIASNKEWFFLCITCLQCVFISLVFEHAPDTRIAQDQDLALNQAQIQPRQTDSALASAVTLSGFQFMESNREVRREYDFDKEFAEWSKLYDVEDFGDISDIAGHNLDRILMQGVCEPPKERRANGNCH